jgi:hypothetical protein
VDGTDDWFVADTAAPMASVMPGERGAEEAVVARESRRRQREVFMKGSGGGLEGWFTAYLPTPAPILRGLRDFSQIAPESAVGLANRMPICDVCNAEADGVTVLVRVFQRAVADGKFNPFRLGLATGRAGWSESENLAYWAKVVRENETDWFLCHACHRAFHAQTQSGAGAPARAARPATAPDESGLLPETLEELRRRHPLPAQPGVPADWKPGFFGGLFGSPKPWGGVDDAVMLLRHGRIAEARELLKRLVAHDGNNLAARLWLSLESRRPPHDETIKAGVLVPALPRPERDALETLIAFATMNGAWLGEAFLAAMERPAGSEPGALLQVAAFVAGGDLWMQTQLLHPRGRAMENIIVTKLLKSFAQVLERRHDEAWALAYEVSSHPATVVESYGRILTITPTAGETETLTTAARNYANLILGLILFDLGYEAERRPLFAGAVQHMQPNMATACRLLA